MGQCPLDGKARQSVVSLLRNVTGARGILTDAGGQLAGPVVVLLADPDRRADEAEARNALVHHRVPIAKVLADHLAIDNLLWDAAVAG